METPPAILNAEFPLSCRFGLDPAKRTPAIDKYSKIRYNPVLLKKSVSCRNW
jgi:hypothetical protein